MADNIDVVGLVVGQARLSNKGDERLPPKETMVPVKELDTMCSPESVVTPRKSDDHSLRERGGEERALASADCSEGGRVILDGCQPIVKRG